MTQYSGFVPRDITQDVNVQASSVFINENHKFPSVLDRDEYFLNNPDELINDMYCVIGTDLYQWDVTGGFWQNMLTVLPVGAPGPPGESVTDIIYNPITGYITFTIGDI